MRTHAAGLGIQQPAIDNATCRRPTKSTLSRLRQAASPLVDPFLKKSGSGAPIATFSFLFLGGAAGAIAGGIWGATRGGWVGGVVGVIVGGLAGAYLGGFIGSKVDK